jgi:hexosaminidase
MPPTPLLLPAPSRMTACEGVFQLPRSVIIRLDAHNPADLMPAAERLQDAFDRFGCTTTLSAGELLAEKCLLLQLDSSASPHPQGYRLEIRSDGISITAPQPVGVFYGVCTLAQLLSQMEENILPCLSIEDHPDVPQRGVMLDISRDRVYRLETLFELIDRLAGWKVNQLQLYIEHTFAYRDHRQVWRYASPLTGEDILRLDAFCRQRYITLIPCQASFGHMARWLVHPRYQGLAEVTGDFKSPWGTMKGPFSLAAVNPASLELMRSLYDELLPHFSARTININCDETVDLGAGQSKAACAARGAGRVYLDYIQQLYADLNQRGYTVQFWGDIILQHPELVAELPADIVALLWGYEGDHPFAEQCARLVEAERAFYVCPGTSSWNSIAGRTDNALANLVNAAENGIRSGASGFLNTDWGDNGHWQAPPVSYLGFAMGAAYAWCLETNRPAPAAELTSRFAFDDPSGSMGRLAYDLGNVYKAGGSEFMNESILFAMLQMPLADLTKHPTLTPEFCETTLVAVDSAASHLANERMTRPDAPLIRREFENTIRLLRHACRRGLLAQNGDAALRYELGEDLRLILAEYVELWLARSQPGGLPDSLARFAHLRTEYNLRVF